jgi:E3 ubiquitin-protein ligase synoviolin
MDERYPNATEAEMSAMEDKTCIICREEMVLRSSTDQEAPNPPTVDGPNMTPKKLPCGHVFHFHCLRSWLERQQSCPTWFVHLFFKVFRFFEQYYAISFFKVVDPF